MFVASLLSIHRKSSFCFAWWVHILGGKYYNGKRQVSEFARFKMFPIKKIIEIDRDISKKTTAAVIARAEGITYLIFFLVFPSLKSSK